MDEAEKADVIAGAFDWEAEAVLAANVIHRELAHIHRGALTWRHVGVTAVFGNDGISTDPRSLAECDRVVNACKEYGYPMLAFACDGDEKFTWVVLVATIQRQDMHRAVWDAWIELIMPRPKHDGFDLAIQKQEANALAAADRGIEHLVPSLN